MGDIFSDYLNEYVESNEPINMDMTKASDNVIYELADNIDALNLIDPKQLAKILVRVSNRNWYLRTLEQAA